MIYMYINMGIGSNFMVLLTVSTELALRESREFHTYIKLISQVNREFLLVHVHTQCY